jgi:type II secretory pathway pseudopilin PulG
LTLIELLAVIVIVATATGVLATGFGARNGDARLRETAASLRDLDARARLLAQTLLRKDAAAPGPASGGPHAVTLTLAADGRELWVVASGGMRLASVEIPKGIEARLTLARDGQQASIGFDRLGRSPDYECELRGERRALRLRVAGLTGLIREVPP